jgi:hypothetical protein
LYTYDILANEVGHVVSLHYINTSPNSTKLLLTHTIFNNVKNYLHFLRVKAYNKIEVYGSIDVE